MSGNARQTRGAQLLERTQIMLPGEQIRYVFCGEIKQNPILVYLTGGYYWLMKKIRIVAVTDTEIVVFKAGNLRWQRNKPKQQLYRVARQPFGARSGRWKKVQLGPEKIRFARAQHELMGKADAALSTHSETPAESGAPIRAGALA